MNIENRTLKKEERVAFQLRALYEQYGYMQYRMSKFEEYDLYVKNKDFLISDAVITFTDTNGKLMALKPDVTLSIIKNCRTLPGAVKKVYYHENVYRVSASARCFKEIPQAGLECMGDIDEYCLTEVVALAARSLRQISERSILSISHLGVLTALLEKLTPDAALRTAVCKCCEEKNSHELRKLCRENDLPADAEEAILGLIAVCGRPKDVLPALKEKLSPIMDTAPLTQLEQIAAALSAGGLGDMLRLDFSVISDIRYYNGIVFQGFAEGAPDSVLSGGQYDKLMRKVGEHQGAIGFAVYLDRLERLEVNVQEYDVDTLLLYEEGCDAVQLMAAAEMLRREGSVAAVKCSGDGTPEHAAGRRRARRLMKFEEGEVRPL